MPRRLIKPAQCCWRFFHRPPGQLALAVAFLLIDYYTGAFALQFPIAFIIPVGLAAWYNGAAWAYFLAIAMPAVRLAFTYSWKLHVDPSISVINFLIRASVMLLIAYLIQRTARQTRELAKEVKLLEGILPICCFCKRIRDEKDEWQQLESYIAQRTAADFSHGYCPECVVEHFGDYLEKR
jgi:K+-sensing histidine kinase KdpD